MKKTALILMLAASVAAAAAQTPAKPATTAAKPATTTAKPAATGIKLPPGVPAARGVLKTAFSLRYQDTKIGTGAVAEPNKLYKVHYTGWLAADGRKFDSSYDHPRQPVLDKDGKPVLGDDGKPKQADPQPISFPQGFGRVIPGWDQGFEGMKIGGKRRIFIPWQLAYGAKGRPTNDPKNPGIPPKADLIFDVELVDVTDMPMPPNHPGMGGMHAMPGGMAPRPGTPAAPGTPAQPGAPKPAATPAAPGAAPNAAAPATPAAPAAPNATPAPAAAPAPAAPSAPAAPANPAQPQPK
jgi:peptidylprolyl isomerase